MESDDDLAICILFLDSLLPSSFLHMTEISPRYDSSYSHLLMDSHRLEGVYGTKRLSLVKLMDEVSSSASLPSLFSDIIFDFHLL